jgi:hypothetical protein
MNSNPKFASREVLQNEVFRKLEQWQFSGKTEDWWAYCESQHALERHDSLKKQNITFERAVELLRQVRDWEKIEDHGQYIDNVAAFLEEFDKTV